MSTFRNLSYALLLLCLLLSFLGIGSVAGNFTVEFRQQMDALDTAINGEVWQGNAAQALPEDLLEMIPPRFWGFPRGIFCLQARRNGF